jgi:hypothetical protein
MALDPDRQALDANRPIRQYDRSDSIRILNTAWSVTIQYVVISVVSCQMARGGVHDDADARPAHHD